MGFCRNRLAIGCFVLALTGLAATAAAQERGVDRRRTPVVEVFEQCRDAVVNLSTTRIRRVQMLGAGSLWDEIFDFGRPRTYEQRITSVGSGVVIHPDGFIVTNAHVVAQATDVRVTFADKQTKPAEIIAVDQTHDLAVIRVQADSPLSAIRLARPGDVLIGETVVAIGNPLGLAHSVTTGIVSATDRSLQFAPDVEYSGLLQTDTAINPGNSGGPLLNLNGDLIGINSAIRGDAQNVGFSIPVARLWELLPTMLDIERRERVSVGLQVDGPAGTVQSVRPNTPAAEAGLKPGDRIVRLNDQPLKNGIDFYARLLEQRPGSQVRLTVARAPGGREQQVNLKLQPIPPPDGNRLAGHALGLKLSEFDQKVRARLDLPQDVGLIVEQVTRRGPADRAGIEDGDIIQRIRRMPTPSLDALGLALESVQPGERLLVEGIRVHGDGAPFAWQTVVRAGE